MTARSVFVKLALTAFATLAATRPLATAPADDPAPAAADSTGTGRPAPHANALVPVPPKSDRRVRRGCDLLAEYLGTAPPRGGACALGDAARGVLDPPLVVVLPDPIDSRLDWAFDGGVEAVRRAYERAGYVLDRFWLPWAADADTLHGARARRDDPDSTLRAAYPGVLLFKRVSGAPSPARAEVRLAYVLGEVATGGVNQAVFDSALADRARVLGAAGAPPVAGAVDTLRVVGPVFSGSVRSIARRLRAWTSAAAGRRHAVVISGGATAASNKDGIDATAVGRRVVPGDTAGTLAWGPSCVAPDPTPAVDFWATANPVDSVLAVARRLLRVELGIPTSQVAVLREASTAFGAAAGRRAPNERRGTLARPRGAVGDCLAPVPAPTTEDWLEIPVPMNVARLRGELLRALAATTALPGARAAGRTPLDLQDPATARENLPALSGLSAAAAERTMEDIAQTLIAHHVRAVVIVASDVRDRIYLATEVRTRLRDVKVVVVGTHALYLRPEVNQPLRGTLVVSSYPLFLESQFWDASPATGRQRFAFTGDLAAGTFNATLLQLGEGERMVDYAYPLAGLGLPDWATPPTAARTPPVWTTVVGRAAMLPVRADSLAWAPVQDSAGRASTAHWYVAPRSEAALRPPPDPARIASASLPSDPPSEAVRADVSTLDDWVLALVLGAVAVGAFAGFRVTDGAAPFGTRAGVIPAPARWPGAFDRRAAADARAAHVARAVALRRDNPWCLPLLELELHAAAWTLLRHAALLGTLTPVALVLYRGRIHGAAVDALTPVTLTLVVAVLAAALVVEDVARLRPLAETYGWATARLAVRPVLVALLAVSYAGLTAWFGVEVTRGAGTAAEAPRAASAVFTARALQLGSGVSPLLPLFVGGLVLLASAAWHLARVQQLREVTTFEAACAAGRVGTSSDTAQMPNDAPMPNINGTGGAFWRAQADRLFVTPSAPPPAPPRLGSAAAFGDAVGGLRAALLHLEPSTAAGLCVVLLATLVGWVGLHIERTPEMLALGPVMGPAAPAGGRLLPSTFDLLFRFVLGATLALGGWTLFRFVHTWWALRRCLAGLTGTGLVAAFGRLPALLPELSRLTPFSMPAKRTADAAFEAVGRERWAALRRAHPATAAALDGAMRKQADEATPGVALTEPGELCLPLGCDDPARVRALAAGYGVLYRAAEWGTILDAPGPASGAPPAGSAQAVVQEVAALYVVDYVEWVVRHLRRLAFGLLATLVLATVLLSSYPFEPQSLVRAGLFVLMAASVGAILTTLVQMNRDPVLSAVTHTDPGKVTWDAPFVVNLVLVGAVPALTLLGTQFPEARDFLFSWVTPILRTVGRN